MALLSASLFLAKWIEHPLAGIREVMGSNNVSHFEVPRETGSALCRIALWDCIREAIASFIGCYEVA